MFRRVALTSVLLSLTLAGSAHAQVNLRWKFREGDTFYLEEKIVGKTAVTTDGQKFTDEQVQDRLSRFVVKSSSRDAIVLDQRIEWWKSKITGAAGGDQDDTKLYEQLSKSLVFTIHLSAAGSITRFEGFDQFLKKLDTVDAAEAKRFKAAANEDVLRGPLALVFDILPTTAVKKDQTWKRDNVVPLGPMGTFKLATTFTYLGLGDRGEQIGTKATLSFQPSKADAGDLGFKILKLDLTKKEAAGKLIFDNAKGRLVQLDMTKPLAGNMVVDVMGVRSTVQFDGTESQSIRILDKRPAPPKS